MENLVIRLKELPQRVVKLNEEDLKGVFGGCLGYRAACGGYTFNNPDKDCCPGHYCDKGQYIPGMGNVNRRCARRGYG